MSRRASADAKREQMRATARAAAAKSRLSPAQVADYAMDPVRFARDVYGLTVWSAQERVLRDAAEIVLATDLGHDRIEREIAVRSGNGIGKSMIAAVVLSWWFDCLRGSAFITAPTAKQAKSPFGYLRALRVQSRYALPGEVLETEIRGADDWWIRMVTARDEVGFQGMHAFSADGTTPPRMLGLVDEASGVGQAIYTAIRGCVTGGRDLLLHLGNPNLPAGDFAACFRDPHVRRHTISSLDSPNVAARREVVPGLVSHRFVESIARRFGRDSDVYRVRVLGLPPRNDHASVVSITVWEQAKQRAIEARERLGCGEEMPPLRGRERAGLDPAGDGSDASGWVVRDDVRLREARRLDMDTPALTRFAADWLRNGPGRSLAIDAGGLGLPIFESLAEEFPGRVVGVLFGSLPVGDADDDWLQATGSSVRVHRYADRRTEIWHRAARWYEHAEIGDEIEPESLDELETDVLGVRSSVNAKGQLQLEKKAETRVRIGRSPDLGDAAALCVEADMECAVASAGAQTAGGIAPRTLRRGEPMRERRELVGAAMASFGGGTHWRVHR